MRRAGDWLNAFGALCALVWAVGAVHVTADAPPLNPSRERLCADYTLQRPPAPAALPPEIGALAQYGAPYWGTWMPPFVPVEPALVDTYPACLQDEAMRAIAQARLDLAWGAWVAARADAMMMWAIAPLGFAPALTIFALLLGRRAGPAPTAARGAKAGGARHSPLSVSAPAPKVGAPRGPRRAIAPNAPTARPQLRKDAAGNSSELPAR